MFSYMMANQADQFSFVRIPKTMLTDDHFAGLSLQAKVLYGILLDRMKISLQNQWLDGEGHVYIVYPVNEIQDDTNLSRRKVQDCLAELEKSGLVERRKQGNGQPNCIYVKNYVLGSR